MNELVRSMLRKAAAQADCSRRQVGAMLVAPGGLVLGVGYNGLPTGSCSAGACPRGLLSYDEIPAFSDYRGNCNAIHAEVMAIQRATRLTPFPADTVCYVTCQPCPDCAAVLVDVGVQRVEIVSLDG